MVVIIPLVVSRAPPLLSPLPQENLKQDEKSGCAEDYRGKKAGLGRSGGWTAENTGCEEPVAGEWVLVR